MKNRYRKHLLFAPMHKVYMGTTTASRNTAVVVRVAVVMRALLSAATQHITLHYTVKAILFLTLIPHSLNFYK